MDYYNASASTEDLGRLASVHGLGGPVATNSDSGFATRHTVIVEVVEGLDFVGGGDRKYYVKLGLETAQWSTSPSLKSRNPAWREYFIGDFVGTKLESPSIVVRVKHRRTRAHLFGVCKIPLLSVSGTDSLDRWYDLHQTKLTAGQPKLRLRITCRKSYDKKSEVEVEVQLINSIISQEREVIAHNTEKIARLTSDRERKAKSKHKVQKLLRGVAHANKKIRALQAKKQVLLDQARHRKILLSQSEMNFCVPGAQQDQSRPELQERLLSVREKLRREQEAFEFHKRYSGEVEGDDKEDWAQNTDELKRRLAYLKNREKTYLGLLQEAIQREKEGGGGESGDQNEDDEEDDLLEVVLAAQNALDAYGMDKMKVLRIRKSNADSAALSVLPAALVADRKESGKEDKRKSRGSGGQVAVDQDQPFPGVRFHPVGESFSALKGAKLLHHLDDDDYDDFQAPI